MPKRPEVRTAGSGRRPTSLLRSLGYFIPSYGLAVLGYLSLNVVAGRALGSGGFGRFAVIVNVTALVGQFALCGLHRAGLREAAQAESAEELGHLRDQVRSVVLLPLPLASVGMGLVNWLWGGPTRDGLIVGSLTAMLTYASGYQILNANFLRGLGHVRAASLLVGRSGGALVALLQTAGVLAVTLAVPHPGLAGVLIGTVGGFVPPLLWGAWLMNGSLPQRVGRSALVRDLRTVIRGHWRFTMSQAGGSLNSSIELWIAGAVLPAVGISQFAAAQRLGRLLLLPSTATQTVFSPAIARLSGAKELKRLERVVRTAASMGTVASGTLWIPMVVFPSEVVLLVFGNGFQPAPAALVLIATQYFLNAVSGMSATTLSMSHHEADVAVLTWIAVALRCVAGTACALAWGATGLAASALVVATLYYAATWWAVRLRLSIWTHATARPSLSLLGRVSG